MLDADSTDKLLNQIVLNILEDGYAVVDAFLDIDMVNDLLANLNETHLMGAFTEAGIGNIQNYHMDEQVRGDKVLWIVNDTEIKIEKEYLDKIAHFVEFLNRTCYLGIHTFEFHYALYPIGTHYERHLDRFRNDSKRKLSMVCYLNKNWTEKDGGELALYVKDAQGYEIRRLISPLAGRMVCFESERLEHEVLPSKKERKSVTGWLKTD